MDALHIAFAESTHSDYFITCDDRILLKYEQAKSQIATRVIDPVTFIREVKP